jgi:hypothetical protein
MVFIKFNIFFLFTLKGLKEEDIPPEFPKKLAILKKVKE